ncbi:MAG: GMC family oxidoreductase, partial [Actinobacteria bacterium]|nr:GMC family oxidoreductase [Actinomycetota bacterium]
DWPPLYLHMQSSMRMGRDARTSVVDGNQESWQVKGLFITDASSLPDGLGGPNPTLTNQMFATRTAEHIAVTRFGRDPFVVAGAGRTTPAGFGPGETAVPVVAPGHRHDAPASGGGTSTLPATGGGSVVVSAAAITAAWALRRRERAVEARSEHDTSAS